MPKTYRVVSEAAYKGHARGETFTADLRPDEEDRAVLRGAIVVEESPAPIDRAHAWDRQPKKRWDAD